jgi:hypothetical protein
MGILKPIAQALRILGVSLYVLVRRVMLDRASCRLTEHDARGAGFAAAMEIE